MGRVVDSTLYIDGDWVTPGKRERLAVVNPTTELTIAHVAVANASDIDRAVDAARTALPEWAGLAPQDRCRLLALVADRIEERAEDFASAIVEDVGTPVKLARRLQVGAPVQVLRDYARAELPAQSPNDRYRLVREPVGVIAAITPWNYPLYQVVAKVGAALAAGCTVVLKPSEVAPLAAVLLTQVVHDAGLPPGVLNLLNGDGRMVGGAPARHADVDAVSFTGSTRVGIQVARLAATTIKRVTLELGGKSANIVLRDADIDGAVRFGVTSCFVNSGQTCLATSRLLVHEDDHDRAVTLATELARGYVLGDPTEPSTSMGPLVSAKQRTSVRSHIRRAVRDGAKLTTGGPKPPSDLEKGFFVQPSVFGNVSPSSDLAQQEVFGPVLAVIPYATENEAIRIANGTQYGLAAGLWTEEEEHAMVIARRLEAGQVNVNGQPFDTSAPFGGYKRSGYGRELGALGVEEFLQTKAVLV